ncbi:MAG: hypothetical protein AB7I41_13000 [Candidatus Sericytochromatia bacterium]
MKNSIQKIKISCFASLVLSPLVGCATPQMALPPQTARPVMQNMQSFSAAKMTVFKYKLMIPTEQQGDFMLDIEASSELMGLYFGNPQYKTVYQRTFVDSTQVRKAQALIISFDVFDKAVFTQQVLPQVKKLLEVKGRKFIAF